jgi:hypothetical protein
MFRCPTSCKEPGCRKPSASDGKGFCTEHKGKNSISEARRQFDRDRADDEIRKLYATTRWLTFRGWLIRQNPMCQRIQKDGSRCPNASALVHHLLSPRTRPDLFTAAENCVCLCLDCHTPEAGTPQWRAAVDYVPAVFSLPSLE